MTIAAWRDWIETTFGELTDTIELARHGAHTFHGLFARTAATIAAHTIAKIALPTRPDPTEGTSAAWRQRLHGPAAPESTTLPARPFH